MKEERDFLRFVPEKASSNLSSPPFFPFSILLPVIRFIATWTYLLSTVWFLWLFVPTMIFHPLLRKLGVPNYWLPIDVAIRYFTRGLLLFAGIKGVSEGTATEPTVMAVNHLSALDAFILVAYSPISLRAIMKRTMILYCPPLFGLAWAVGCITIDRKAKAKAISALQSAAGQIQTSNRAFMIFPEGTRSKQGSLQEFKKGAFHMAKDAAVSITPAVTTGPYDIWPPGSLFPAPGTVKVSMLSPIDSEQVKSSTVEELLYETRKRIVEGIENESFQAFDNGHFLATAPAVGWLFCFSGMIYYFFF